MAIRVKLFIGVILLLAGFSVIWATGVPSHNWMHFYVYLAVVLLSSGMKVAMPKGDGTMSVNFPFIFLALVELSPAQAVTLACLSVFAQCRFKVLKPFTFVQIAFNLANVANSTFAAWLAFDIATRHKMELAPALSAAAVAYFFVNTVPIATVIGWSKGEKVFGLWRREFPWYLPFYLVGAVLAAVAHIISLRWGWATSMLLVPVVYTIYRAYQSQKAMLRDRQTHLEETEALHLRTIEGLAMAIEAKDHNTHDHLLRVRVYVSEIGKSLGLDDLQMQALLTASFLHDIGKLAVPEHIINKPGKLTPEEFEKMKIHPQVGADILTRVRFPYPVVPIVRSHHEAWDGSGYPDGLKGEEIPIGARILTVVDCFDALASERPYRRAMPLDDAMALVKSKAGIQFDPRIVAILEQRYIELEELARNQSKTIEPLKTEISVWRGAAPGAGFQEDNADESAQAAGSQAITDKTAPAQTRFEALNLIAEASHEAQAIFEMSQMLGSSLSPNETISMMSSRLRSLISFDCLAVYLKVDKNLSLQYIDGECAHCFSKTLIPLSEGLSGWVAEHRKPILNGNPKVEPNYDPLQNCATRPNSALSLPLFDLTGAAFGVLTVYSSGVNFFSRDHLRIMQAVESKFSLSLQNALRFRNAEKDATIDFVTQLPNVREFFLVMEKELQKANESGERLGVIVCDLNSFKAVNDRYGHMKGNLLLRAVAAGFRDCCRSYDTVARMGGDEFVFLLPGIHENSCAPQLTLIDETVRRACRELHLGVEVSCSIGAAFYPADNGNVEELLGLADRRMYLQKRTYYETIGDRREPAATKAPLLI
jgi:diguanylate cyclase (GGDEF)-like protein/putative nucleotidyltransferase with HDIG domain